MAVVLDVGFETAVTYGLENTTVNVPFSRNSWGSYKGAFSVAYHTSAVTAIPGSDYIEHSSGVLEFEEGINSQNITIIIKDDAISDPWKALTVEIDSITPKEGCVTVNVDTSNHTVFIVDDEPIPSDGSGGGGGGGNNDAAACANEQDRWNEIGNMATGIYVYDFDSQNAEGTVCYISGWLENNIGELNNLIFSCYNGPDPGMGLEEEAIYRQIFLKNHYAKMSRNTLRGITSSTSESESEGSSELITSEWTELRDGDSYIKRVAKMATPAEKNKTSKLYKEFADAADINLKDLLHSYNLYKANPRQVAGKDAPADQG
jgi:hypothetical protein